MATERITKQETQRRLRAARAMRHSTVMEGGSVTEHTRQLQESYARGEITEEQMMQAFRERYGLSGD